VALAAVKAGEERLAVVEGKFGWNHLAYDAQLQRLLWGEDGMVTVEPGKRPLFPKYPKYEEALREMTERSPYSVWSSNRFQVFDIAYN
jgi:hypothetical protein